MKDCPYIEFGTLIYDTLTVRAVVYRRSNTAALLRLPSERLLVEMCIMFGNDFTSEYAQYTPSPYAESPAFQQASAVSSYVDWFSTVDPSYKAESITNVELSIAIKYSRAFYELENLDIYRSELKAYRIANSYCEPQLEMSFSLSIEEKDRILGWYLENRMPTGKTSGMIALRYLERKIVDLNGSEVHISHEHFEAFSKMLDVTMNSDYTAHPFRISMKWLPIPSWDDLLASHVFQLVMLQLVHIVEKFDGTCKFLPKINFDGAVFHGFLNILKSELAAESVFDITTSLANKFAGISVSDVGSMAIPNQVLPIDAYQEEILYRIGRDRVTIIHGETGCGKSSRVPAMLLEESKRNGNHCKMMISQPRRIAASSLMKRLRETIGVEVGMRMGHGVKDESSDTKLFFVTTGYLVRLLAYHPSHFNNHTHLIIDEVHERSVDGDVLCYLARRLLNSNSNIKLVLMSATMHIKLYQDYFAPTDSINYGDLQCLSVGVRRFPLQIFYSDNMCSGGSKAGLPKAFAPLCDKISKQIEKLRTIDEGPSLEFVKNQYAMVNHLVREVVELGTGVLVFVSGIADITEISDYFADDNKYVVVAIHSDIPFEEQELAFQPVASNQIKVVIATNAAESSITLPDVDVVICLGTHKAVRYDTATRRVQLVNQFISKASSNQRAGRTGRTRPGKVYRLYTSQLFDKMNDHDLPEVMRKPLEDVILNLRAMLEESRDFTGVVPILESLLEAPKTENIEASFEELYLQNMITIADDNGELTPVGRMAGNLPVDMHLSRLIALGISLGIGAEAVAIAAALSIPKTPFRIAHFLIHKGM